MEWTNKVRQRLTVVAMTDAGRVAARTVVKDMRKRIFDRGETPDGAQIGTYSTEPIYISLSQMSKTGPGRKTRGGKSKFFSGGYAQYKSAVGARGFNLRNFGVMMRDFTSPIEIAEGDRLRLTFGEERNQEISDFYPQAWGMSPSEKEKFTSLFVQELQKRLERD